MQRCGERHEETQPLPVLLQRTRPGCLDKLLVSLGKRGTYL